MVKDARKEALEKYRHMSFVLEEYVACSKFKPYERAKSLRTFLAFKSNREFYLSSKILADLLSKLTMLRVLYLTDCCISEVPETIGSLKHLRYLNLSRTLITHLPENVGNLYNLQILILFGCRHLNKLPNNFSKLKNLRHLEIGFTPLLNKLPLGIGQMKSLQIISKIIVEGDNGFAITMLKDLPNLTGNTHFKGLEKVETVMHAREANFYQKRFSGLLLEWSEVFNGSRKESLEKEVLCLLKPHNDRLKMLGIVSYGGIEFPNWVGDPSFLQLTSVSISGCKNCTSLPPLGRLPSLKTLLIEDMDGVKAMGSELTGTGPAFPSLQFLELGNMKSLEVWSTDIGAVSFQCLQKIVIRNCPNLIQVSLEALPLLTVLKIFECDCRVLRGLVQVTSRVKNLVIESISGLNNEVWRGVIEYLDAVEYLSLKKCNRLRYLWESTGCEALKKLRNLDVEKCKNLVRLGKREEDDDDTCGRNVVTSLQELQISECDRMKHCRCPNNIEDLRIFDCSSIASISFPTATGGQKLKFLCINRCEKLSEKELILGGDNTRVLVNNTNMPMLQRVEIITWRNLTTVIELSQWIHLTYLGILNCPAMTSFPDHELPNLTSLRDLLICTCPSIDASFPRGFWPPKLQNLYIGGLKKPILDWGPQNFPTSLVKLVLNSKLSEDDVGNSSRLSVLLPSSLTSLVLINFKYQKSFSAGLQHLTSLQHLTLWTCPKLRDLPDILLPSLLSLTIKECPSLEGKCSRRGSYWSRISHIPCIRINTGNSYIFNPWD